MDVDTRLPRYWHRVGRWGRLVKVEDAAVREPLYFAGDQQKWGFRYDALFRRWRRHLLKWLQFAKVRQ